MDTATFFVLSAMTLIIIGSWSFTKVILRKDYASVGDVIISIAGFLAVTFITTL